MRTSISAITPDLAKLVALSREITDCRVCDDDGLSVTHPDQMHRGRGSIALVVGIEPGLTEVSSGIAFSGPAGQRLLTWLSAAGAGTDRPRIEETTYFTSLAKCRTLSARDSERASRNCLPFLIRQLELISPRVVITLGQRPLTTLFSNLLSLEEVVGAVYTEAELNPTLFPVLAEGTMVCPLPHPSPRSRWLNSEYHQRLVRRALGALRRFFTPEDSVGDRSP